MRWSVFLLAAALAVWGPPLSAREANLAVPGGSLADVTIAVARATNSSIIIADRSLARRRVAGLRGRMDAGGAVRAIARANGLKAIRVGPDAWRLVADNAARRSARTTRPPPRALAAPARRVAATQPPSSPPPMEPIVVIASKRDLRIDELPAQISILEGESLELGGTGGTEKIAQRIATVSSTHLGSGRNKLFIRGIADSSFTGPTQATVGQYLGDLRLSYNAPDPDLRLSDMERVEVLEGPQGTLYGSGSLGGIIRLVPRTPEYGESSLTLAGGAMHTDHGEPGGDGHATLNLPVGADAALRVNFDFASQGGYIDKPGLGRRDVNRTQTLSGRAGLRMDLGSQWTLDLLGVAQETTASDSQYADRAGARLESSARVQEGARARYGQVQTVLSGELGDVRIRSSTGFSDQNLFERYDATLPEGDPRLFVQRNDTRLIANETRAWQPLDERFGWLVGASFIDNLTRLTRSLGAEGASDPMTATGVLNTVTEITGYGEASVRLFEPLIAAVGVRATHARLGGQGEDVPLALALAGSSITAERTETAILPSASLLAQISPDARIYARYQEGFRPGGLAVADDFVRQFRSDHVRTVELGAGVGEPGRGRYDLSANIAHSNWRDIQADFIDGTGLPSTANVGNGTIWTISFSGSAQLAAGLRIDLGGSYNDSKVDEPVLFAFDRLTQVPNVAQFSGRAGLDWNHELASGLTLDGRGWVSYIGKSRLGIGPELGELQGDYLDSGLLLRLGRERAGLTIAVTNIADVQGNRFAFGTPFSLGREQITPLQPRTIRVGMDARF